LLPPSRRQALLVRHLGTTPFFPIAGIFLTVAILGGNTQRAFRDFGRQAEPSQRETSLYDRPRAQAP
jgi:hypothetical protein